MTASRFVGNKDVQATRATMDKPIGMIITDMIGNDFIEKKFKEKGVHPEEFGGMPTGKIAVKTGVVSQATNDGLLLAQSGERIARAVEKAKELEQDRARLKGKEIDPQKYGFVDLESDVAKRTLKFALEEPNAKLRHAQLTAIEAQRYLNQVIDSVVSGVKGPEKGYADRLMQVAVQAYVDGAATVDKKDAGIIKKLSNVANSLLGTIQPQPQVAAAAAQAKNRPKATF